MGRLKELIKGSPVHERRLEFRTYPLKDGRLIVEGWLRDERFKPGYHWNGRPRPPGVVHWICVRMLVGGWPPCILEAEAEMPQVPHELCPTTLESVKKVVGMTIVSGYSEEVRKRLGGIQGCTHMTHLITVMGPAALHGYWNHYSRKRRPLPRSMDQIPGLEYLINSCTLWKEDGPMISAVRAELEKG
jgi:hypothetical protein